jgi:hypothetical protein
MPPESRNLLARLETDWKERKGDQEDLKGMMAEMKAKMDCNWAETTSILCTFRSELKETIQRQKRAAIQSIQ